MMHLTWTVPAALWLLAVVPLVWLATSVIAAVAIFERRSIP
jgi:hypothetical protein